MSAYRPTTVSSFLLLLIACMLASAAAVAQTAATPTADEPQAMAADNATAQPTILQRLQSPGSLIIIEAPEALLQRANPPAEPLVEEVEPEGDPADLDIIPKPKNYKTVGYRVQVYADNNVRNAKAQARQRERALTQAFPQYTAYVSYASPYWRVRVGDFTSQYDAERAAAEIRRAFPSYAKEVRVVRDRVNASK